MQKDIGSFVIVVFIAPVAGILMSAYRHKRMHLTSRKETTKPAANNFLQQREKFDRFIEWCYNPQRPQINWLGEAGCEPELMI